jgi:acetyl-CoA carboxylase biotin carboxyl carrier protein
LLTSSDIAEILRLIDSSDFQEVKLKLGDTRLEWRRGGTLETVTAGRSPEQTPSIFRTPAVADVDDGLIQVTAPMLGAFWHSPRPGDPPFVVAGDRVTPDTIIGIIEVMKLMNTVPAGVTGEVTEICAANGKGVEFGQTLIRVRPA